MRLKRQHTKTTVHRILLLNPVQIKIYTSLYSPMYSDVGISDLITMNYIDQVGNGSSSSSMAASSSRRSIVATTTTMASNLNWLIHAYYARNDFKVCERIIEQQQRNHVDKEFSYRIKGMIARSDGRFLESLHNLQQSINLNISNAVNHKEIGRTL